MALRSRSLLVRTSALVVLAALVGVGLVRPGVSSAEPTVAQFLLAWESRHYLEAAKLTTGQPQNVAAELSRAYTRLDASNVGLSMQSIDQDGRNAEAAFSASIDLSGSGLLWSYTGRFRLRDYGSAWRIVWSPSVIVPGMTNQEQLAVVSSPPQRAQILDSAGQSLIVPSNAYEVGVTPDEVADPARTAVGLAAVTGIPADQIEGQIEQNLQADFLELVTYDPADYARVRASLAAIPGLKVKRVTERLFDSIAPSVVGTVGTETAGVLRTNGVQYRPGTTVGLSGLEQAFQRQLVGTPETDVVLQQSGKAAVLLKKYPGTQGTPVRTTLNASVQRAADQALAGLPSSAAIVAVQATTGQILAVGSHTAGGMPDLNPLAGQYEPGQAFTIISSAALLAAGRLSPSDPVPCPANNSVDGRVFTNDPPEPDLGATPSFQTDFSHACATAFAGGLSLSLNFSQLSAASRAFGIGGWALPVTGYYAGSIGDPADEESLAAAMIGTGEVQVSPLNMALAAAVADSGRWHDPSLVQGLADASTTRRDIENAQVLTELRAMMRSAMETPANQVADVGDDVYGQVGSAPFGTAGLHSDWLVGYQGDVAFAVVELDKSGTGSAAPLAGSFLAGLQ